MIKNPSAAVYIVSGAGGSDEGLTPVPEKKPDWSRVFSSTPGYGLIHLLNSTHLLWEQLNSQTIKILHSITSAPKIKKT